MVAEMMPEPARAAFRTNALVLPGAMLEIEFIAAKKVGPMKKMKMKM